MMLKLVFFLISFLVYSEVSFCSDNNLQCDQGEKCVYNFLCDDNIDIFGNDQTDNHNDGSSKIDEKRSIKAAPRPGDCNFPKVCCEKVKQFLRRTSTTTTTEEPINWSDERDEITRRIPTNRETFKKSETKLNRTGLELVI